MIRHDEYGKQVLRRASNGLAQLEGPSVEIDYGCGGRCRIDGTVASLIAVEVEARTGKQVRGALVDLRWHPFPKKLLLLLPGNMNLQIEVPRCRIILCQDFAPNHVRVVGLHGNGNSPDFERDVSLVSIAVRKLLSADVQPEAPDCH